MAEQNMEAWIGTGEAAKYSHVCRETLTRAVRKGELAAGASAKGRRPRYRFRKSDIDAWLKRHNLVEGQEDGAGTTESPE